MESRNINGGEIDILLKLIYGVELTDDEREISYGIEDKISTADKLLCR
jgi:hypothetical protein